jgi:hypothetical protein
VDGHRTDIRGQVSKDARTSVGADAEFWLPAVGTGGSAAPLMPFLGLPALQP